MLSTKRKKTRKIQKPAKKDNLVTLKNKPRTEPKSPLAKYEAAKLIIVGMIEPAGRVARVKRDIRLAKMP